MFEKVALVLILVAQIYRILRSEALRRQENQLHKKIEEHLGALTPAGLWPQYEALKRFNDEVSSELTRAKLELSQLPTPGRGEDFKTLYGSYEVTLRVLEEAWKRLAVLEKETEERKKREEAAKRHAKFVPTF